MFYVPCSETKTKHKVMPKGLIETCVIRYYVYEKRDNSLDLDSDQYALSDSTLPSCITDFVKAITPCNIVNKCLAKPNLRHYSRSGKIQKPCMTAIIFLKAYSVQTDLLPARISF